MNNKLVLLSVNNDNIFMQFSEKNIYSDNDKRLIVISKIHRASMSGQYENVKRKTKSKAMQIES